MKRIIAALTLAVFVSSCASVPHLSIPPMRTAFPVSASGYYFDPSGAVVDPSQYEVLRHFKLEKTIKASITPRAPEEVVVDLGPELSHLTEAEGGEAVVNLVVSPVEVNNSDTVNLNGERIAGPLFAAVGTMFIVMGVSVGDGLDSSSGVLLLVMGDILALAGVIFTAHATSILAAGKQVWKITVEGDIVQRL